jgi:hypothetical protein
MYDQGADGLNLFNMSCWLYSLAEVPWDWIADLHDPVRLLHRPQLYPMIEDPWQRTYVDQVPVQPTAVPPGGELRLTLGLPRDTLPAARALLLVVAEGTVEASVNGTALGSPHENVPVHIFPVPPGETAMVDRELAQREGQSFYVPGELLRSGPNEITITTRAEQEITIKRADLGLWPSG